MSGYILFHTTAAAFLCEQVLKDKKINVKLLPTPREYSSDCGISAYFYGEYSEKIAEILTQFDIEFDIKECKI